MYGIAVKCSDEIITLFMVLHIDLYAVVLQLRAWCKALIVLLMLERSRDEAKQVNVFFFLQR